MKLPNFLNMWSFSLKHVLLFLSLFEIKMALTEAGHFLHLLLSSGCHMRARIAKITLSLRPVILNDSCINAFPLRLISSQWNFPSERKSHCSGEKMSL